MSTSLNFRLSQSQLVQNLFEFQGGTSENQIEAVDLIQMIDSNTARVGVAIILVAHPPDTYYPIDIHMTIRALLVAQSSKLRKPQAALCMLQVRVTLLLVK
ncbi:hypothetical protein GBAR_LOCUS22137, partial [Geodia barretti]